jgi:diguanylate cyclase
VALRGADGRPGWRVIAGRKEFNTPDVIARLADRSDPRGGVLVAADATPVVVSVYRRTVFPPRGKSAFRSWKRTVELAILAPVNGSAIRQGLEAGGLPLANVADVLDHLKRQVGIAPQELSQDGIRLIPGVPAPDLAPEPTQAPVVMATQAPQTPATGWLPPILHLPLITIICTLAGFGLAIAQWRHVAAQFRRTDGLVERIEADAYDRAMRDPLTGLHNRSGFKTRLDQAILNRAETGLLGVIYIDLDRFKEVNDSYGHDMGDKLLVAVTERLKTLCVRKETIARLGGDEFAVIVEGHPSTATIEALGETFSQELGKPFILSGTRIDIGGSVGVAVAPEDGTSAQELVRRADISMYRSKAAGRGQSHRFHPSMEDEVRRRTFLESELRFAIERNELDVFYQPVMASDGETLIGCEALLRWVHQSEGVISPALFIPIAEQSGMIGAISQWMMRKAMSDIKPHGGLSVALNVSPAQFKDAGLVQSVVDLSAETGMEIARIEMEVTEGVLVEDADTAVAIINAFREHGFRVSLDDFGTGYASLSYLKRFRFDKLKIDQVFVRNLSGGAGSGAIVHAVVALGRALGLAVQAEGVESLEHHIFLRAAGCQYLQGYYFGKPMSKTDFDAFAEKHARLPSYSLRRYASF